MAHIPMVQARFVQTGLLNSLGQPILRLRSRPVGFRANLDEVLYAVDEEWSPDANAQDGEFTTDDDADE